MSSNSAPTKRGVNVATAVFKNHLPTSKRSRRAPAADVEAESKSSSVEEAFGSAKRGVTVEAWSKSSSAEEAFVPTKRGVIVEA